MATKSKLRRIVTDPKVVIVIAAVLIAIYSTGIPFSLGREGVVVRSVEKASAAYDAGIRSVEGSSLAAKDVIVAIDGQKIRAVEDYADAISGLEINQTLLFETNNAFYRLTVKPEVNVRVLPELEETEVIVNATTNETKKVLANKTVEDIVGVADLGLKVANAQKTNLRLGLDLQGGARVMLKPETELSKEDLELVIANMNKRLNLFGLSDVVIRDASDLSGSKFILVEVAGANEEDVRQLIARQGKFDAKIANETVFTGNEVTDVCRSAQCSGIDFQSGGCFEASASESVCRFYFTISLSQEAAAKQAAATGKLAVVGNYLSQPLQLYLDDELVDELQIGKELKGNAVTAISISGSGSGSNKKAATTNAINNMKRLQTILITGSLPVKLEVVRTDSISPILGEQFLRNALKVGLVAILFVVGALLLAYRKLQIAIPVMFTSLLEIFIMLGFASLLPFLSWTIDLAAIAGIIAAVGTGVNDQIIITDEALKGEQSRIFSWKEKLKSAFAVIFGAYFTLVVAMLPLFAVGAGLLRGFALTTIIGMSVGVFITRPAYAKVIEILMERD
ncbi:MAG: PDZ domain-containing protein [Nanoarchaeota archaeon]